MTNILMVMSLDRVILFREIESVGFNDSNNKVQGCDCHFHPEMLLIYLFGVLHHFQHCTGHTTGSWKGRGNQYIQFVRAKCF